MIALEKIALRRGSKLLLENTDLRIQPGEKVALIGRNGAGKSSLFALFSGTLHEDSGNFVLPAAWQVAQVAQNLPDTEANATDFVLSGDNHLIAAQAALTASTAENDGEKIALAHAALQDAGAHDAKARAQALILGLGFSVAQLDYPVNSFSGGWQMRLQLARALMCPSDLLLLDEPTNHLDLDALVWLEQWLRRYSGTLIVISHDREFLDAICQVTVHLENGGLKRYSGNYSSFEEQRAAHMVLQQAAFAKQQDKIAHLQKFIDRFKAQATKAKQAQSRVKAIERMEKIAPILSARDFSFSFRDPGLIPNPMLSLKDAALGYGEKTIVSGVSRSVLAGQRIGILGANGQGKSTLVKTIAGQLPAISGHITEGKGLAIGYFAQQELDVLHADLNPLEHMLRLAKICSPQATEQELRNFLGSFLFTGDMVSQAVGSMSGGEKARLVLALIVWQKPNLLLLDEPTNHLDLATREALAMALNEFEGSVLLVSHDRALLRSTCDEFWLVGAGEVKNFDGDLDDYQRYLLDHAKAVREAAKLEGQSAAPKAADGLSNKERHELEKKQRQAKLELARPLKKELQTLEKNIETLSAEQQALHTELASTPAPEQIAEAGKRLASVDAQLEAAELRWLEVGEQLQTLEA
ncbi:MAG: ABC-F family ATP-binding cassette domain-containing protein [Brachymonas sp.]|jgi:ATP-binding cassette subfamily F protein 3